MTMGHPTLNFLYQMGGGYQHPMTEADVVRRQHPHHPAAPSPRNSLVQDYAHHRQFEDVDERVIEARLLQQKQESAADAKWLQAEEKNLVTIFSLFLAQVSLSFFLPFTLPLSLSPSLFVG